MASEFDDARTVISNQVPGNDASSVLGGGMNTSMNPSLADNSRRVQSRFREFLRHFRTPSSPLFLYRDQLVQRYNKREFKLEIDLEHLNQYDEVLSELLLKQPDVYIPLFEAGAKDALRQAVEFGEQAAGQLLLPDFQVTLRSSQTPTPMREILANDVNHLLLVPGIIISASKVSSLPTTIVYMCKSCKAEKRKQSKAGLSRPQIERSCPSCGAKDQQQVLAHKCEFVDRQFLKLQEAPEVVRTGEMPRHISLYVERYLVDQVAPGARVAVMGVSSVFKQEKGNSANNKRRSYLRVVGIQSLNEGSGRVTTFFTPQEERMFVDMSRDPQIYDKLTRSIAPSISGDYTNDIKKAIACLLFGGSRRLLPDGMKLRGDINVLLLGDPSTAKSQFLKFVEKVAPVGVYTSGKGSSAAGLTASVIRDGRGEFYLEGGAMVLADGGVVCIDEFDKMREQDRVAIHEAMEQQTISVAKAGITTILNSRTSVLAAANPVFGTYDDNRSAAENIDFLPTILSRFDLIFIVRDVRDEAKDRAIARHVLGVHVNFSVSDGQAAIEEGEVDLVTMKKYISYCRNRCAPVLTPQASEMLRDHYVGIREAHRSRVLATGASSATVPITIRQLEAIVRISEALAKMQLSAEVTPEHVAEATRLFKVSTLSAASTGALPGDLGGASAEQIQEIQRVEEQFKRRVAIGSKVQHRALRDDFVQRQGYNAALVDKALRIMEARNEIQLVNKQRMIQRLR